MIVTSQIYCINASRRGRRRHVPSTDKPINPVAAFLRMTNLHYNHSTFDSKNIWYITGVRG